MPKIQAPCEPIDLMGLSLHPVSVNALHTYICRVVRSRSRATLFYLNVHGANLAQRYPPVLEALCQADLVYCDGDGIRWAAAFLNQPVPEKIPLTRWIWELVHLCEAERFRLFLLGAAPGVAEAAAQRLKQRYPKLSVHTQHGYFKRTGSENDAVVAKINATKPDVLLVGFGMPVQEEWILQNQNCLEVPILLSGGGVLDYTAGRLGKAPEWLLKMHLEWLFRIFEEPQRLFLRYALDIPCFFYRVLLEKLKKR